MKPQGQTTTDLVKGRVKRKESLLPSPDSGRGEYLASSRQQPRRETNPTAKDQTGMDRLPPWSIRQELKTTTKMRI